MYRWSRSSSRPGRDRRCPSVLAATGGGRRLGPRRQGHPQPGPRQTGQTVTVSGRGLPGCLRREPRTWFVTECTAAVRGRMNPSTDTPHCDITHAQAAPRRSQRHVHRPLPRRRRDHRRRLLRHRGHATCVIGVGTAQGQGTVVRITFKTPTPPRPAPTTDHHGLTPGPDRSGVVQPLQVVVPDDPAQPHADRLLQEVGHRRPARDGRGLRRRGRRREREGPRRWPWSGPRGRGRWSPAPLGRRAPAALPARRRCSRSCRSPPASRMAAAGTPFTVEVHRARLRLGALVARLLARPSP